MLTYSVAENRHFCFLHILIIVIHREVIVTFDMHPAIAVAKLNNKYKTSQVAHVTLVLWIGNKTLRELSHFGNASGRADCLKPL